jgi:hypothetical protein
MVRFILSAVALAGFLATARPGLADPVAAVAPEQTRAATAATEQSAPPANANPDAPAPVSASLGKGVIAVGFGWG